MRVTHTKESGIVWAQNPNVAVNSRSQDGHRVDDGFSQDIGATFNSGRDYTEVAIGQHTQRTRPRHLAQPTIAWIEFPFATRPSQHLLRHCATNLPDAYL